MNNFFLLFQKLYLTLLAKNQVPICLLSLSKFNIELAASLLGARSRRFAPANSRFATGFFLAHRIHVFAPAAPWDRVRGKNGIEIGVEMAERVASLQ